MRITADRNKLLPIVAVLGGIVEKRQTLPILSNILVRISETNMSITATDLEVELNTNIEVTTNNTGEFTLPARKFIDICKALPDGAALEINIVGEKAQILSGKSRFTLGLLPAADYPSIEMSNGEYSFEMKENDFKFLIDKTAFAMAQQDVRYYLNGLLVEFKNNSIKAISTDGHRLAICEKVLENTKTNSNSILLPRKAVVEIGKLLKYTDSIVSVEIGSNLAKFTMGEKIFITKLIDGKFPDYERVIPKNCSKTAIIDSEKLYSALVRASILSSEKYKGIRITVDKNILKIQSHNPEQEEAEEELEIVYEGDEIKMGFNVGYLLDILSAIGAKKVAFDFADTNTSSIIRNPETSDILYVVMPMRL